MHHFFIYSRHFASDFKIKFPLLLMYLRYYNYLYFDFNYCFLIFLINFFLKLQGFIM